MSRFLAGLESRRSWQSFAPCEPQSRKEGGAWRLAKVARQLVQAAQSALPKAEKVKAQFKACENARFALGILQAGKVDIEGLADQVGNAKGPRLPIDAKNIVDAVAEEVRNAEHNRKVA